MRIILAICCAAILSACTTYGDLSFAGGVTQRLVGDRVWAIEARGNAFANEIQIRDFVYLRAAEIGLEAGLPYFVILDEESGSQAHTYTNNTATYSGQSTCDTFGCRSTGTLSGPTTSTYYKPNAELRAMFLTQEEYEALTAQQRRFAVSVQATYDDLAPRYIRDHE